MSKIAAWRRLTLIHNMVAAVDVKRFPGDEAGGVVGEEAGGDAHVLDADEAARRRLRFRLVEQRIEFGDAGSRPRRQRSGRDGVHADALRAELGGDIADRTSTTRPCSASFGEKAMECTTKSSLPQSLAMRSNTASIWPGVRTSSGIKIGASSSRASGSTYFLALSLR